MVFREPVPTFERRAWRPELRRPNRHCRSPDRAGSSLPWAREHWTILHASMGLRLV